MGEDADATLIPDTWLINLTTNDETSQVPAIKVKKELPIHNTDNQCKNSENICEMSQIAGTSTPTTTDLTSTRIKLPSFWKNESVLWFAHIEALFFNHRIHSDEDRYNVVLAALNEPEVLSQVTDIIRAPPKSDKYNSLKEQLISRFTDSKERQLNKLLNELSLQNKKPSQLLREMLNLAPTGTPEDVIRTLWMNHMPTSIRCILSATQDVQLTKLADIADRILEHSSTVQQIQAVSTSNSERQDLSKLDIKEQHFSASNKLEKRIERLEQRFDQLTASVEAMHRTSVSSRPLPIRSTSRSRSQSRPRVLQEHNICYFHRKFKDKAQKCTVPCNFHNNRQQEN